jgi:hypothetical protein
LEAALAEVRPDVICLVETWRDGESTQPGRIADRLGLPYQLGGGRGWLPGLYLVQP